MKPIEVGERVIVSGIMYAKAIVSKVEFIATEARWAIYLDWGQYGTSKVYDTDENKVWFRYSAVS